MAKMLADDSDRPVQSEGEESMYVQLRVSPAIPTPCRGWRVCEHRKWEFDFAWPDVKVALEVEGGTKSGKSRHSKGQGFVNDCEKYNAATLAGWKVYRVPTEWVHSGEALKLIERALEESHSWD